MKLPRELSPSIVGLCCALLGAPALASDAREPERPKLIVVLVVDQMRSDYLTRYGADWSGGLRRLLDEGAWFRSAAYSYFNTVTCAGHATIGTGTWPSAHGMVLNRWWERSAAERRTCTEDPAATQVSYGAPLTGRGHTAHALRMPTLADELRAQAGVPPRVVTLSLKARSAIALAGRRADAVSWFDASVGAFVTSSAYPTADFVRDHVAAHPISTELGREWSRLLPEERYQFEDAVDGERPDAYPTNHFPHRLASPSGDADEKFFDCWKTSPFSDAYLARLALSAVDALGLGQGTGTDFLGVSFSALDYVGHDFGPRSHEVQDLLAQLDRTLAELFEALDRKVGRGRYAVALSADHGVAAIPEQLAALGLDAGRARLEPVAERAEQLLAARLGPGPHVAWLEYTELYLLPGLYRRLESEQPALLQELGEALAALPGIERVLRGDEIPGLRDSSDPVARAVALGYYPGRSGDLVLVPRPGWLLGSSDSTTHGTGYSYDTGVPVILMGPAFRAGEYWQPATPADIAPTLGALVDVRLPRPDGRVLLEALRTRD